MSHFCQPISAARYFPEIFPACMLMGTAHSLCMPPHIPALPASHGNTPWDTSPFSLQHLCSLHLSPPHSTTLCASVERKLYSKYLARKAVMVREAARLLASPHGSTPALDSGKAEGSMAAGG